MIQRLLQTFQNVGSCFSFSFVINGAADNDIFLMIDVTIQHFTNVQNLRLTVHKSQHNYAEGVLHLGIFIQIVQHNVCCRIFLHFNHNAHTHILVGLVTQVGNAFQPFFVHQLCDFFNELCFVYLIRKLGNDNALAVAVVFNFCLGTNNYLAAAGVEIRTDAAFAHNVAGCGKIGPLDIFHNFFDGNFGVINGGTNGINTFG